MCSVLGDPVRRAVADKEPGRQPGVQNEGDRDILLVKHLLYEKRYTIEGAKRELKKMRQGGRIDEVRKLYAEPAVLGSIKENLVALRDVLTLPDG